MATPGKPNEMENNSTLRTCPAEIDHVFRILLIGDSGVGKSGLLLRFTLPWNKDRFANGPYGPFANRAFFYGSYTTFERIQRGLRTRPDHDRENFVFNSSEGLFTDSYNTTIGVEFKFRTIEVDGKAVKLQIWDTSGQERFRAITANYYRNIHGIMVVYDISNQNSFDHVDLWLEEITNNTTDDVCKILVGNKCDLKHQAVVNTAAAKDLADKLQIPFLQTSVKSNVNVDEAFRKLAIQIMQDLERVNFFQGKNETIQVDSVPYAKKRRKGCCVKKQTEEDDI